MGAAHISPDLVVDTNGNSSALVNALHPHMTYPDGGSIDTFNNRLCSGDDGGSEPCRYDQTSSGNREWESMRMKMPDVEDEKMIASQTGRAKGVTREVGRPVAVLTLHPLDGEQVDKTPVRSDAYIPTRGYAKWL